MAIVDVTTTPGALADAGRATLTRRLAALTYEAEGFAGSTIAPSVCWTFTDERAAGAFSTGVGDPDVALCYVEVTAFAGSLDPATKARLGAAITAELLAQESGPTTTEDRDRVWVRFIDVADGDLIVGGESTSRSGLRALIASEPGVTVA